MKLPHNEYLAAAGLLYVDDACGVLLLQVVDEACAQVVTLCHHLDRVPSTWHGQQHTVLRLRLSTHQHHNLHQRQRFILVCLSLISLH